jgi:hypothetical protein
LQVVGSKGIGAGLAGLVTISFFVVFSIQMTEVQDGDIEERFS